MRGEPGYQFSPPAQPVVFHPQVIAPPRVIASETGTADLESRISKGFGTVHAITLIQPRQGSPDNVCLADVDEGFRMMGQIEDIDPAAETFGLRVKFRVHPNEPHRPDGPGYPSRSR
jgi:uncharacterized OB-fold protein